jgi:diguanylate cyclase (GGDEF)-like protein
VAALAVAWLWFGLAQAASPLTGGWREARTGDTPAMLLAEFRDGKLSPFDPAVLHRFPRDGKGSWVVIAPRSPWLGEERVLTIYPPPLGSITVYDDHGPIGTLALDDFTASLHAHGRLAFRYGAKTPPSAPILLKFEPSSTIAAPVSFQLQSYGTFQQQDSHWLVYATGAFAVMLTMALMAACFALMLRDVTFAWYAGYILCYALIQGVQTGFLFHPLELDWLADSALLIGSVAVALSVAFAALFMTRFCELQRYAPLLAVPVLALAVGMPLVVLMRSSHIGVLEDAAQALVNPLLLLGALLLLIAAITAAARGSRPAWFFLIGWTPLLVLTALSSAQVNGALPNLDWLNDACIGAGAFEAIVLSLGLADRALIIRNDRDKVRALADNDALTGLLNRRAWTESASHLLETVAGRPLALLFLDLDRFKMLNDVQGHAAGDRALIAVADALRAELRPTDLLGRYGGEEFVAMLDGVSQEQAMQVATRLCRRVYRLEVPVDSKKLLLSISIGLAMRAAGEPLDSLIDRADQAMYQAKLGGRNRARCFERRSSAASMRRRARVTDTELDA